MSSEKSNNQQSLFKKISILFGLKSEKDNLSEKFKLVYNKNLFKGKESISGPGSDLIQTETIRKEIPKLLKNLSIHSMIDAPCGDFFWMKYVDLGDVKYTGLDIVQDLINKNNQMYSDATHGFLNCNIVNEKVPQADLIFSRDCLVHLTYEQALNAIKNFKQSGAKYLLTTTFPGQQNQDLGKIIWRPLDLCQAPFNFPQPELLINENCTENNGIYSNKSLGLWDLSKIRIS